MQFFIKPNKHVIKKHLTVANVNNVSAIDGLKFRISLVSDTKLEGENKLM